ncbi:MAG TPA: O-methyltransferase [Pseudonocardiaceae bacterium]
MWTEIDDYLNGLLLRPDEVPAAAQEAADAAGLPAIAVAPNQGKLLRLIALATGARRVLEIGTLAGYSTIWLAGGLPADGRVTSLEVDPRHAEVARANLAAAGFADRAEVLVGPALETLPTLEGPFDLVFIDADKKHNADYFGWAVRLSRPGTLIVVDNVVRGGGIVDAGSGDPRVLGTRRLFEAIAAEPRVDATAVQTVGAKGHDGLAFALVRS